MIIAVDFDGTLCISGKPNTALFLRMRQEQKNGNRIILYTCRTGKSLLDALRFCAANGLKFDGVYGGKLDADLYIDDKAVSPFR